MADDQATGEKKEAKKLPPKRPTAKKRDLQNEKRRLVNKSFKSQVRSTLRAVEESLSKKDKNGAEAAASKIFGLMDKGVKRNLFKRNKADRTKSRLTARLKTLAS